MQEAISQCRRLHWPHQLENLEQPGWLNRPRDPRSDAYKRGVHAALTRYVELVTPPLPFDAGTAEADAFFAGEEEGRLIIARTWEQEQVA